MIEDSLRAILEQLSELKASTEERLARIEQRLPPTLGDRARVRELTGLSDATITRHTRTGQLRSVKVGGRRLWDLDQLRPASEQTVQQLARQARGR